MRTGVSESARGETASLGGLLQGTGDVPMPERVMPGLDAGFYRQLVYLPEVGSTNDVARERARAGAPEGTIIVADRQTRGRGRRGRAWASPAGSGLWFSLVLRPPVPPRETPLLALLAAAAVREAVAEAVRVAGAVRVPEAVRVTEAVRVAGAVRVAEAVRVAKAVREAAAVREAEIAREADAVREGETVPQAEGTAVVNTVLIKWPNDVVDAFGRKLGGILVELDAAHDRVRHCVVGIGVNVNQRLEDFPPELRGAAVSVRLLAGRPVERVPLLQAILAGFAARYRHAVETGFGPLLDEVRRHSATLDRDVRVMETTGNEWDGRAVAILDDGALLVQPAGGGPARTVYAADVSIRSVTGPLGPLGVGTRYDGAKQD